MKDEEFYARGQDSALGFSPVVDSRYSSGPEQQQAPPTPGKASSGKASAVKAGPGAVAPVLQPSAVAPVLHAAVASVLHTAVASVQQPCALASL